jgi:hypothetical protein
VRHISIPIVVSIIKYIYRIMIYEEFGTWREINVLSPAYQMKKIKKRARFDPRSLQFSIIIIREYS